MSALDVEFDWDCRYSDHEDKTELLSGEGHINLDYRKYFPDDYFDDEPCDDSEVDEDE